jgi:uncharacterized protein YifE (UPF0438 family)
VAVAVAVAAAAAAAVVDALTQFKISSYLQSLNCEFRHGCTSGNAFSVLFVIIPRKAVIALVFVVVKYLARIKRRRRVYMLASLVIFRH